MDSAQSFNHSNVVPEITNSAFCTLCLRQRPSSDGSFFGYNIEANSMFGKTTNAVLGVQLDGDFYTCKSCFKLVQLLQEFRTCCLEANVKLRQFGKGLQTDDKWLTARTAQVIESVRVTVAAHAKLIGKADFGTSAVKCEPVKQRDIADDFPEIPAHFIKVEIEEPVEETEPEYLDFTQEMVTDMVEGEILIEEEDDDDIDFSTWIRSTDEETDSQAAGLSSIETCECSKCQRTFGSKIGLNMHFPQCRGVKGGSLLKHRCHICSISFRYPTLLKDHMNKHEGKTPYKCRKQCDKSFAGSVNRYIHEVHCAKEPQNCPICNCNLKSKRALKDHMTAVHREPKHACGECGLRFQRASRLTQHRVKLHGASILKGSQQLVVETPLAVKATPAKKPEPKQVEVQVEPTANVTGRLPFECDECGKGFTYLPVMLYHKRRMHSV